MDTQEIMRRMVAQDGIKQEFEQTLGSRVNRYLKVKPHGIIPLTEFASVSAECALLFRDGHFYGAIALSQAVAEAVAKFLCQKNGWKPKKSFVGQKGTPMKLCVSPPVQVARGRHVQSEGVNH
jgi:hypothetical protein